MSTRYFSVPMSTDCAAAVALSKVGLGVLFMDLALKAIHHGLFHSLLQR